MIYFYTAGAFIATTVFTIFIATLPFGWVVAALFSVVSAVTTFAGYEFVTTSNTLYDFCNT